MNLNNLRPESLSLKKHPTTLTHIVANTTEETSNTLIAWQKPSLYPAYHWYNILREKYWQDKKYEAFFSTLEIDNNNDIKLNHKLFRNNNGNYTLTAEPNNEDIVSGDFNDGETAGLPGVMYMTGKAATEQAKKQGKKLCKTEEEVNSFIDQFPWESKSDKVFSFITLFNIQNWGLLRADTKAWNFRSHFWYVMLSEVIEDKVISAGRLNNGSKNSNANIYEYDEAKCLIPVLAFEDC